MTSSCALLNVLLLSPSETFAVLERRALREAGVTRIQLETSGIKAARALADQAEHDKEKLPDIVVCGQKLCDMSGERFCAMIRLHPMLLALPVLLILANDGEMEQLRTLGCGASALLARPYSIPTLKQQLALLQTVQPVIAHLRRAEKQADIKAFDEALKTYGLLLKPVHPPVSYFKVGMQCLHNSRWNNAIEAFQRALRDAQIKGEAELGIAAAYKGKNDTQRFRAWLARAAETFVQANRWRRACSVYARLRQEDPQAKNPFLSEVGRLLRLQRYDEAALVLAHSFDVTPLRQACGKVAQTCLNAEDPQRMLHDLEASLDRTVGSNIPSLGDDIRTCLETLTREQEIRRRQASLERRRELARQYEERRIDVSEATAEPSSPVPKYIQEPFLHEDHRGTDDIPHMNAETPLLTPLTEADASSELFSGRPWLNEILSVVKCTWKLTRFHQ